MELTQFAAVVLLTLLVMKLLLLPVKVGVTQVVSTARWLTVIGIVLLDIQFLLQYALGLRAMGVTQAVLVNLLLFIPSSWTLSLAVSHLQGLGRVKPLDKWIGGVVWVVGGIILVSAAATDGQPLFSDTPELHRAEVVVSGLYLAMQCYYAWRHATNLLAMRRAIQNYYDRDMGGILLWMQLSIVVLMVLALMVPMLIFVQRKELAIFAVLFFGGIFFFVDGFCNYVVSSAPKKVSDADENVEQEMEERRSVGEALSATDNAPPALNPDIIKHVEEAVRIWIENGGYLHGGTNMPTAAAAIGIPRYQLSAYLHKNNVKYATWMTILRIDEAKRVIRQHPEWSNEAVALHCGFSDRSYFQKKFKEATGLSPAEFLTSADR